ncbi:MAG: F0F1 ATP synthase subunit B [Propionibacteriaceae bacterium]|jgi:F-type H+-transporting ATPase subunit b|nr:F0F1 ATP synthase subunit B [Propionibacteriaceae bacterium]
MLPLEGLGPLLPEHLSELFVGIALFAIIWFVVAKKIVPLFEKTYAERTAAISGGLEKAEAAQREASAALEEYKAQLADARAEAAKIRDDARTQAAELAAEIKQQATDEAARLVETARVQLEAERSAVVRSLRSEIGGLATELAGKIVGESLADDERSRRSVERFLDELESQSAPAK